jgi:hypothetical protein
MKDSKGKNIQIGQTVSVRFGSNSYTAAVIELNTDVEKLREYQFSVRVKADGGYAHLLGERTERDVWPHDVRVIREPVAIERTTTNEVATFRSTPKQSVAASTVQADIIDDDSMFDRSEIIDAGRSEAKGGTWGKN